LKVFIFTLFQLLGSLGVFLLGMRMLSDGVQKAAGEKFQNMLNFMTQNRFSAVFTGLMITSLIQSSSATTVILVSLVNAGLMSLKRAIGVIMGANIGTTMTAWIVAFVGFKFNIAEFAMPAIAISLPMIFNKHEKVRNIGELIAGLGILFLGLSLLKNAVPDIKSNIEVLNFITYINGFGFFSILLFIILGTILTVILQSSSAAMVVTITMGYKGWITFEMAAALCLGENIGTTVTAFLASLGMNTAAKRAARAHMIFNIIGVVWVTIIAFYPLTWFINRMIVDTGSAGLPLKLSIFHSIFNVANTLVLIGFISHLAKLVEWLVPDNDKDSKYKLSFIETSYPDFAEVNIKMAKNEIGKLGRKATEMIGIFLNSIRSDLDDIAEFSDKLNLIHDEIDDQYREIGNFLAECRTNIINDKQSYCINGMIIIVSEIKSISNSAKSLVELIKFKRKKRYKFHKNAKSEIEEYTVEVLDFLKYVVDVINNKSNNYNYSFTEKMESAINLKRDRLKKNSKNKMIQGADIQGELVYMDVIKHLEHIGDFTMNISHYLDEMELITIPVPQ